MTGFLLVATAAACLAVGGCSDSLPVPPTDACGWSYGPLDDRGICNDSPFAAVGRYAQVLELKDYAGADRLIAADFAFIPRDDETGSFPDIVWDRETEMAILANMFDPDYPDSRPALSIEFDFLETGRTENADGSVSIAAEAVSLVLWSPTSGWFADTALTFLLRPDPDDEGLWQVARVTELPHDGEPTSLEPVSWAALRAYYLSPPIPPPSPRR